MKCCDYNSGMLRNLVDLQWQQKVADGAGGNALQFVTYAAAVRSMITPMSAGEKVFAQRVEKNLTHRMVLRYRTDIKTDHRVVYNGRLMQIRGIINIEELDRWLRVELEEGVTT